ncbi:MAG: hypothetical protein WDW38_003398 [Sanguina aurantia]
MDDPWETNHSSIDDADLAEYLEPEDLGLDTTDWARRLLAVGRNGKKGGHFLAEEDIYRAPLDTTNSQWGQDQDGGSSAGPKQLPAEVRCFDTARIYVRSGDGGAGCVAFRREKFVEFGGPAGGDGGPGGNVWAVADSELNSLSAFRQKIHWRAAQGVRGQGSRLDGAKAADMYVPVPAGTIIRRRGAEDGEPPLAELLQPGQKALLLVGGRGGRGNYAFKTSTNKAPTLAEKGELGNETWIDLELKVVADVGIIGIPNAGKSTLLSVVTAARPKIANYPFTTLVPNLGVCELDYRTTVFADVPGLLEGAHEGLGLGHQFLRHVQRCRVLLHVIDGTSKDPVGDFRAINLELELFNPELKDKPQIVAYNKIDCPDSGDYWEIMQEELEAEGVPRERMFAISGATGQGVTTLVRAVRTALDNLGPPLVEFETNALNVSKVPKPKSGGVGAFTVTIDRGGATNVYYVQGRGIEKFAQMTNWDYYEAMVRFQKVLDVCGINKVLRAKGCKEGDAVVIGDVEFTWSDDQRESHMYGVWLEDMKNRGVTRQGVARWPHAKISKTGTKALNGASRSLTSTKALTGGKAVTSATKALVGLDY